MKYYINCAATSSSLSDIKTLIPDANMRRRMSHVLRMGVATAMECLNGSEQKSVDAVITATGLGCLADSEKFLRSTIENGEQLLNPTPFIQSTFNTVGGQVALITGNHGYNMTYSHRDQSFECALLDTLMLLEEGGATNVLLGAFDEQTPTQTRLNERLGLYRGGVVPAEGAHFFVVSTQPTPTSLAEIERLVIDGECITDADNEIEVGSSYHTATAEVLYNALSLFSDSVRKICITNKNIKIVLKCM